jgi:hypothetical protein
MAATTNHRRGSNNKFAPILKGGGRAKLPSPGENYLLSFWLDNTTSGFGQRFQASWNGSALFNVTNPAAFSWTNLQFIVTAASSSTELQFGAENNPAYFGLDDISVTHIPAVAFKTVIKTRELLILPGPRPRVWSIKFSIKPTCFNPTGSI